MAFLTRGRSLAVATEATFADIATVITDADYIDYTAGDMSVDIEQISREVLRNSLIKLASIPGQETSSGSITVELSEDNLITGVNGDKLFSNGIGIKLAATTPTTVSLAVDGSNFTVTSSAGMAVGGIVKVAIGTGDEFVQIVSITGNDLVVTPALSVTPTTEAISQVTTYILPRPGDEVLSLLIREHLEPTTGNAIDYDYRGCMVDAVAMTFPVGGIATAAFTVGGAGSDTTTPAGAVSIPCETLTPVVGKNAVVRALGTAYTAQDISLNITTTNTDIRSITTDGITNKVGTDKAVSGTFRTEYTGTSNFDAMINTTTGEFHLQLRDGNATSPIIVGAFLPQIKFTSVNRTDDAGILYDEVTFEAESPDCVGNERTVSVYFAN